MKKPANSSGYQPGFTDEVEELEELEDLEAIEEPEELPSPSQLSETGEDGSESENKGRSSLPCLDHYQSNFNNSPLPFVVTDKTLKILWANRSFYEEFTPFEETENRYLTEIFYSYLGEEHAGKIYRSLRSSENGYSWRGRVERKSESMVRKIANMLIAPLYVNNNKTINGYTAVFDDITEENKEMLRGTFLSLLEASKLKDNDTGYHIQRVNEYSRTIASYLYDSGTTGKIDHEFIDDIAFLAAMHDVGKIGTPDDVLNKNGPLEDWEWEIMREHTINGAYILSTYPNPMAKEIALFHHERWDGSGYPYGVSEDMIPLSARIVAIADVYDALRMKRAYKSAISHKKTADIMLEETGSHFDPSLMNVFTKVESRFADIYRELYDPENEQAGGHSVQKLS
ncbi:MAG: HD domain-containing protein [Spirochaetales bacterium]|nr:HD domain-containing protein [Spirochaetales bacterium]MCF7937569.1 HD domain-containing protein [Spirochaetales bacterium]